MTIDVEHICKRFGRVAALNDITFSLDAGDSALLAGPNGSGKTTLLRILSCYMPATSGKASVAGNDIFIDTLAVRSNLGYVPENGPIYRDMRVGEYLKYRGRLRSMGGKVLRRRVKELLEQCDLGELRRELIGKLSKGQRMRVAIADAVSHCPKVLLLDEPFSSLDEEQRISVARLIDSFRSTSALICATHMPDEVDFLFSKMLVLKKGRLLFAGGVPEAGETFSRRIGEVLNGGAPQDGKGEGGARG